MSKYYLKSLINKPTDLSVSDQDGYVQEYSLYMRHRQSDLALDLENMLLRQGYMIKRVR
jgi:predicted RNA-binding protein YlqC (UPF0109 family)